MKQKLIFFIFLFLSEISLGQVYTTPKKFVFDIQYFQNKNNINSFEIISFTFTGKKWKHSDRQLEAVWKYNTDEGTSGNFQNQFSIGWSQDDTTGVIDDEVRTWIHPPRNNQYTLTETAPFPDFRKNKKVDDTYSSYLYIGSGWGEWTDKKIEYSYLISDMKEVAGVRLWTIDATSYFDDKTNTCRFIYSEKLGFTSLDYNFYNGDKLSMKLKE